MPTPVLWWTFQNQDGTDHSGNGNTGTVHNATFENTTLPSGGGGYAAVFNGTNASIDAVAAILTGATGGISLWVRSTAGGSSARVFANSHTDADFQGIQMRQFPFNSGILADVGAGTSAVTVSEPNGAGDSNWHHLVLTWGPDAVTLYYDGNSVATGAAITAPIGASSHFAIGYNPAYAGDYFTGDLFDVRLFTVELTASDVTNLFNNPFTPGSGSAAVFTVSGSSVSLVFAEFFTDVVLTDAPVTRRTN